MSDIAVQQSQIDWRISPPRRVRTGTMFTAVARLEYKACAQVLDAYNESNSIKERVCGNCEHTPRGWNGEEEPSTYVWFNVWANIPGKHKFKFRLTWWQHGHLYGALSSFDVEVRDEFEKASYYTEEQDFLALLEPRYYDPTPIELMEQNSAHRYLQLLGEEKIEEEKSIKIEPFD
ncbi:hypothetical protein SAMD00023353_0400660 [Rosellinia necatrix]|uniref:Uncharacterized protein n=1 Tax=Rosellinia necatrix TaxID=77044 RepID=A0A1S7UIM6_ROSNE|nr:hypothetical protein SAMD00023353_0400660 [Rosellinia necatrix]